jgi:pyrimidine operon attenuation protein / uracil phosphoribosyltransferase
VPSTLPEGLRGLGANPPRGKLARARSSAQMRVLLDPEETSRGLKRVAMEILEHNRGTRGLLLVGVRRGGVPVMQRIADWIREIEGEEVPTGTVDITLYRDDAAHALPNPRIGPSQMPSSVDGMRVILVDDVLYTRRTVRAALDAIMDYGRPDVIELAVLIDRSGRQLPIRPDYRVKRVEDLSDSDRIDVFSHDGQLQAVVQPMGAQTIPPGGPPPAQSAEDGGDL